MANLYVDEDSGNLVPELRRAGHTVRFAGEVGPGRTDAWHLARAGSEGRALVTFNGRDYRFLHRLWNSLQIFGLSSRQHAGILSSTAQLEPSVWVPILESLFQSGRPVHGRLLIWSQAKQRWVEDDWRPED